MGVHVMLKKGRRVTVLCLSIVLVVFCGQAFSLDSAQEYARVVAQLRREGFRGIDTALAGFERIIRQDAGFTQAYVGAADALLVKYEFSKTKEKRWMRQALGYLNTGIDRSPETAQYYFKRALVRLNLGQPSAAEADLKKSIELKPDFLKAQVLYLQYLLSSERGNEARRMADDWLRAYGNDPAPWKYFGDLFFQAQAFGDALIYYRQVVQRVPGAPNTYAAMGEAYWRLGKIQKAIGAFTKALEQNPKMYRVHFSLGTCLGESGDLKGAVDHFQRYLEKFPDDAAALNNLALLYERNGQYAEARLSWMRLKSKTSEKVYLQRAETHLYRLAYGSGGTRGKERDERGRKPGEQGEKSHE